jgi:hypothetical protein
VGWRGHLGGCGVVWYSKRRGDEEEVDELIRKAIDFRDRCKMEKLVGEDGDGTWRELGA